MKFFSPFFLFLLLLAGCAAPAPAQPTAPPPASPSPRPDSTSTPTPPPVATATPLATSTPRATATHSEALSCEPQAGAACLWDGRFPLSRPIPPASNQKIDRTYPYASTQGGLREIHHGVEFVNAQGTPVLAAAKGVVRFAADDKLTLLAWVTGYYGKVVVLEHDLDGQTVFTLYGHLYEIDVTQGQQVQAGQVIGAVGATGTAIGSHLHFEVRVGENNYASTRNPELWLAPLPAEGTLAGSVVNQRGQRVKAKINIQRVENGVFNPASVGAAETYPPEMPGDPLLGENFLFGGLPAGAYRLSLVYLGAVYEQVITVEPGKLTLVQFLLP